MHVDRPPAPLPDLPAVVRRSGRIGVYERDLRTGAGRWDEGMFELCGLDPAAGTPDFAQVLALVHEDDREHLAAFHAEMGAGARAHGELRYRLRRPDGSVRHVHSFVDLLRDASGA
ncbi:MAG: PAS domain-containing protein, partial [Gammaproteobacteria bacterium]